MTLHFDYVIVGGGSAGSVLANRLSADPRTSVCLLEAGGGGKDLVVRLPLGVVVMGPGKPFRINNWAFETVPQPGLNGRRGYQPRGKALGGSSAINAMLYVRGQRQDYDTWAAEGCTDWDWDSVLPYFKLAENNERGADALHGAEGPLQVSDQKEMRPMSRAFVAAAAQLQHRERADFNDGDNEGCGYYQVTQFHDARNGERCSAAAAYLFPVMDRPNLTVLTRAECTGLTFEGARASGVTFRHQGQEKTARAGREVLLCAGALKTPQILQVSGIGDPQDLRPHGIAVRHALPGVGKNLQDHLDFSLAYKTRTTDCVGIGPVGAARLAWHLWRWHWSGVSMAATCFTEGGVFLRTTPDLDRPDVQLHFAIAIVDDHARKLHYGYGFSCHLCKLRPESRGTVRLASADPLAAPVIDPAFLKDQRDLDVPVLRLPDSKTGAKVVHVGQPVADLLRHALRIDGNPWVITGTLPGKPLSDLQPFWHRVRARAGVKDVRIHDLRHTFASTAVASGQGLPMIGKLLGHTQVQTTARYAHLAAEPVRMAADAVAQNLRQSLG